MTTTDLPAALAEPTAPVRARWVALLMLAQLAVMVGFYAPLQVLLPQQVALIDEANKETWLGWVTALGALAAMVVNPLAGALSDRTTSRFGRRHVWTIGGAVLACGALVLLGQQRTLLGVALGWVFAQSCLNTMFATVTAAVPDRVPVSQRATVSAFVGIPQIAGVLVGVVLVTVVVTGIVSGYIAVGIVVLALAVPFVLLTPDDALPRAHRPELTARALITGMWISPRKYPDFAWAWLTRFLVQLSNAVGVLYLLYFLKDRVKLPDPEGGLVILIVIYTVAVAATAVVTGRLSDRSGKRKAFVIWAGVVMAVAAALLAAWPTWPVAMAGAAVLGAGFGIYAAVDMALITQVLPAAGDRGKDLGVINIANSAPQVLAPALAAPIVVSLGGYPVLYGFAAVVALVGSVLVTRIRSVP